MAAATKPAADARLPRPAPLERDEEQRYRELDFALLRRLLGALRPYAAQYRLAVAAGLVHVLCDLSGPKFIEHLLRYCGSPGAGVQGVAVIIAQIGRASCRERV